VPLELGVVQSQVYQPFDVSVMLEMGEVDIEGVVPNQLVLDQSDYKTYEVFTC
jgi:hypothetical protein